MKLVTKTNEGEILKVLGSYNAMNKNDHGMKKVVFSEQCCDENRCLQEPVRFH